jgi:hypothetical protein
MQNKKAEQDREKTAEQDRQNWTGKLNRNWIGRTRLAEQSYLDKTARRGQKGEDTWNGMAGRGQAEKDFQDKRP